MNTIVDIYDYTLPTGNENAWQDIEFPGSIPLPLVGELLYLARDPEAVGTSELLPYRVLKRDFYIQRDRINATPQMRVAIGVRRFEEAEYA